MAIENWIIEKYKGKPSFTNSLLEDANTKQVEKKESEAMHFNSVDEISFAQRFSMDAHYESHYDFRWENNNIEFLLKNIFSRFKYLFSAIDNHMTKTVDVLIPFLVRRKFWFWKEFFFNRK